MGTKMETRVTLLDTIKSDGGNESWRVLNELYAPLVRNWLRRTGVRLDDEDDLIQEVFLLVMNKIKSFEHSERTGSFRSWLKQVTINCFRNHVRKRGNKPLSPGGTDFGLFIARCEDPASDESRIWDEEHERGLLAYLLEQVKGRFQAATYAAFVETAIKGRPSGEVAAELGLSRGAVHTAKSRVLAEMRRLGKHMLE